MKINLQIENGIIVGYTTFPLDEKKAVEVSDEKYRMLEKYCGYIDSNFNVLNEILKEEKRKNMILNKIQKNKEWFDEYYSVHEQKYRRLMYLFSIGVVNEESSAAKQNLIDLYKKAEEIRTEINTLELELLD